MKNINTSNNDETLRHEMFGRNILLYFIIEIFTYILDLLTSLINILPYTYKNN